jgi:hypothetical protein
MFPEGGLWDTVSVNSRSTSGNYTNHLIFIQFGILVTACLWISSDYQNKQRPFS